MSMAKLDNRTIEGRLANLIAETVGTSEFVFNPGIASVLGSYLRLGKPQVERAFDRLLKKGVIGKSSRRDGRFHLS